jgi:hypothetical protein
LVHYSTPSHPFDNNNHFTLMNKALIFDPIGRSTPPCLRVRTSSSDLLLYAEDRRHASITSFKIDTLINPQAQQRRKNIKAYPVNKFPRSDNTNRAPDFFFEPTTPSPHNLVQHIQASPQSFAVNVPIRLLMSCSSRFLKYPRS